MVDSTENYSRAAAKIARALERRHFESVEIAENDENIFHGNDLAVNQLISGEFGERAEARDRAGRALAKVSHLQRALNWVASNSTGAKGERLFEPKEITETTETTSRWKRIKKTIGGAYTSIPESFLGWWEKEVNEAQANRGRIPNWAFGLVRGEIGFLRSLWKMAPGSTARLATGLATAMAVNTLLMTAAVGTLPYWGAMGLVVVPLFLRGQVNWELLRKQGLRSPISALIGLGTIATVGTVAAGAGAVEAATGIPMPLSGANIGSMLENAPVLLGQLAALNIAVRGAFGILLAKTRNIPGWTEDLVLEKCNREGLVHEAEQYFYWEKVDLLKSKQLARTELGRKLQGKTLFGAQKGWGAIAAFDQTTNEDVSPDLALSAAQEIETISFTYDVRAATNPTRYADPEKGVIIYDERNKKHHILPSMIRGQINKEKEILFRYALNHDWSKDKSGISKEQIFEALGVVVRERNGKFYVHPTFSADGYAAAVRKKAQQIQGRTLVTFAAGGAALGLAAKAAYATGNLMEVYKEAGRALFGEEIPTNPVRAWQQRIDVVAGSAVIDSNPNITPKSTAVGSVEDRFIKVIRLYELRDRVENPKVEKTPDLLKSYETAIRDSKLTLAEMDQFDRNLKLAGLGERELRAIFRAAERKNVTDPWFREIISAVKFSQSGETASLLRKIATPDLRSNLHRLILETGLAPEIEKVLAGPAKAAGAEIEEILRKTGLDINNPKIQTSYLEIDPGKSPEIISGSGSQIKIQNIVDVHNQPRKIIYIPSSEPVTLVLQENGGRAEKIIKTLNTILDADAEQLKIATTNKTVDFGRFTALVYEANNGSKQATETLSFIENNVKYLASLKSGTAKNAATQALNEFKTSYRPEVFNKFSSYLSHGSINPKIKDFLGTGITKDIPVTSVVFWRAIVGQSGNKEEILTRAGVYFQRLDELHNPRVAALENAAVVNKKSAEILATTAGNESSLTLGKVVAKRPSLESIAREAYSQQMRPTAYFEGANTRYEWHGSIWFDRSPYPEHLQKELLSLEGGDDLFFGPKIKAEHSGFEFALKVGARNLFGETQSGGSGIATQIVGWLQENKLGNQLLQLADVDPKRYTTEYLEKLASGIFWEQIPPEMAKNIGLPIGDEIPRLPKGILNDLFQGGLEHKALRMGQTMQATVEDLTGLNKDELTQRFLPIVRANVGRQFEQYLMGKTLISTYGEKELAEFWLRYVPLGNVGIEIRGVEGAAKVFFGKSAEELTIAERALILGLAQNPRVYSPIWEPQKFLDRGRWVLKEAFLKDGVISQDEYQVAIAEINDKTPLQLIQKRLPLIINNSGGKETTITINEKGLEWMGGNTPNDPNYKAIIDTQKGGAKLIRIPEDLQNRQSGAEQKSLVSITPGKPSPTGDLLPGVWTAEKAPDKIKQAVVGVAQNVEAGSKRIAGYTLPVSVDNQPTKLPVVQIKHPSGAVESRPGIRIDVADPTGKIVTSYNPSNFFTLSDRVAPGSAFKPFILAWFVHEGIDPNNNFPAWKGQWALNGTNLEIQNPPIYAGLNANSAVGKIYMSPAEALRGTSDNAVFNSAFLSLLEKDPDNWRKFTIFMKKEFGVNIYDGKGNEATFPPALATDILVPRDQLIRGYARLFNPDLVKDFSDPKTATNAKRVVQVMSDDTILFHPNVKNYLGNEVNAIKGQGFISKSGTAAAGPNVTKSLAYVAGVKGAPNGPLNIIFVTSAGQTIESGIARDLNLEANNVLGSHGAYAGVTLRGIVKKMAQVITSQSTTKPVARAPAIKRP